MESKYNQTVLLPAGMFRNDSTRVDLLSAERFFIFRRAVVNRSS